MNAMESLYQEYTRLRDDLSTKNLREVGAFELRSYRRRFEDLHRRNLQLQSDTRMSDVDIEELRQVLNLGDRMWKEVGDTLIPLIQVIDVKMSLGKQLAEERRTTREAKEANLKTLKTLMNQYKRFKKTVETITDPELKAIFEDKLKADEEIIEKMKELDAKYDSRIKELGAKLRIIAQGGRLPELDEVLSDTTGLNPDEAQDLANRMADEAKDDESESLDEDLEDNEELDEGIPGVEVDGLDPVTPVAGGRSIPGEEEVPEFPGEEPVPELSGEDEEPVPELGGEDEEPVPELGGEDEEPVPEFPGEEEEPVPELGGDEPAPETEEEDTPVRATVKQPKTKLWEKVKKVLDAAKVFLLTAIAVHTGLMIGGLKQNVSPEEPEEEVVEETEVPEDNPEVTPDDTEPEPTEDLPSQDTPVNPTPESSPTPEPSPTPAPTAPADEADVILSPGESVYDTTTGVEVGYTGVAGRDTGSGYVPQEDRQLEHKTDTTVVVTHEDFQPDPVQTPQPVVSEAEARSGMTKEEQEQLDRDIDEVDWEAFFNNGPTL